MHKERQDMVKIPSKMDVAQGAISWNQWHWVWISLGGVRYKVPYGAKNQQ